jgi:hypothetical protein
MVGGWAQDRDGQIVCRFLEDAGSDAVAAVDAAARRMAATLGSVRLTARTRGMTWLEQELAQLKPSSSRSAPPPGDSLVKAPG